MFPIIRALPFKVKLGLAAIIAAFLFYGGWYAHGVVFDAGRLKELEHSVVKMQQEAVKANIKAAEYEKQAALIREVNQKLEAELQDEIKKPDYSACNVPSGGVRIYNKALASN